jgi:hypothetical protein
MMDFSLKSNQKYLDEQNKHYHKTRTILKYRIYGKEGVTNREFNQLVTWGVINKRKKNAIEILNARPKTPTTNRGLQ